SSSRHSGAAVARKTRAIGRVLGTVMTLLLEAGMPHCPSLRSTRIGGRAADCHFHSLCAVDRRGGRVFLRAPTLFPPSLASSPKSLHDPNDRRQRTAFESHNGRSAFAAATGAPAPIAAIPRYQAVFNPSATSARQPGSGRGVAFRGWPEHCSARGRIVQPEVTGSRAVGRALSPRIVRPSLPRASIDAERHDRDRQPSKPPV